MLLNDILDGCVATGFTQQSVTLELSSELSRQYEAVDSLMTGINNLIMETEEHRGKHVHVATRLEGSTEILEIFSSGSPLSDEALAAVNDNYAIGQSLPEKPRYEGSKIASFQLARAGGQVHIENCDQAPYTVRNWVVFTA